MDQLIDIHHPVTICRASAGTGKTFTLAAYYVGLLLSGEDYRSILAITFTNKATAEMSERIINNLYLISQGDEEAKKFLPRVRQFMLRDADASEALLKKRADECFHKMLLDFDNVNVMTIDSFLQTLLGGMATIVHKQAAGQSTELDVKHVINTAVDQLLTTDLSDSDRRILENYMQISLENDSPWDVRKSLQMLAEELYNESAQILDADHAILFDADAISRRRKAIEKRWKENQNVKDLKELLDSLDPSAYTRNVSAAYRRLKQSVENPGKIKAEDRFRGVGERDRKVLEMAQATDLAEPLSKEYNTLSLTIQLSREMELMASLLKLIQRNLAEANCALLAKTADTLKKALEKGDADFILEKAGIRYRHVLIDEFQDTSKLQWEVIVKLLMDVLASEGHTLLIVGDIKQSIYRWRNGDWHIMDNLEHEPLCGSKGELVNKRFTSLTRSFRSTEEVVKFNLSLFRYIIDQRGDALSERIYGEHFEPDKLKDFYLSDTKRGGCVRYQAYPNAKKEDLASYMFDQIEALLQKGANPSNIMILVRYKDEATVITDLQSQLDASQYPFLTRTAIVSSDSFLLKASNAVQQVMAALRYKVRGDEVAKRYVEIYNPQPDIIEKVDKALTAKTPLYEAVSELVRVLLTDDEGRYNGTETAYVNALLDRTRDYVSSYGSDAEQFLLYWDDSLRKKPIAMASSNAIQILTVHSSKGLQSQTLFVPFANWEQEVGSHKPKLWCQVPENIDKTGDFIPIQYGIEMANSEYINAYEAEQENLQIDNLNLLYVALTRAEDNLFVYTDYKVNKTHPEGICEHIGKYLMDCYGDSYEVGEPVIKTRTDTSTSAEDESSKYITAELWANSKRVNFIQSQEGALYTERGEKAYRLMARMDEGTLCHEIFAQIDKADKLDAVLDDFESRGEIASPEQRESLKTLISSAWEGNAKMRDWFTSPWKLEIEHDVLFDHNKIRPDRVMINPDTNEAIVLDYKFGSWKGKPDEAYEIQVRKYMAALRDVGHSPVRGFLWYARKQKGDKLIEVHGE